jgi:hypothetical protein
VGADDGIDTRIEDSPALEDVNRDLAFGDQIGAIKNGLLRKITQQIRQALRLAKEWRIDDILDRPPTLIFGKIQGAGWEFVQKH